MEWIYPVSYLVSLSGLVLWFFVQGRKSLSQPFSALFLVGFFIYLAALSLSSGTLGYKLFILFRDMLVMGIVTQIFSMSRNRVTLAVGLGAVAILVVYFSYFQTLLMTFPQLPAESLDSRDEFLIQVSPGNADLIKDLEKEYPSAIQPAFSPAHPERTDLDDYYVVDLASGTRRSYKQFFTALRRDKRVKWIEPNEVLSTDLPATESPQRIDHKFFLNDPDIALQWGFDPMEVDKLHRKIVESGIQPVRPAKVAILDSGVEGTHEDLSGNYLSVKKAYDTDKLGHGTHCAGIAGAVSNNGIGIASLSPGTGFVQIMGIKVINAYGMGTQKAVIDGILEAVDKGADVISLSLGGMSTQARQKAYSEAVQYATDNGVIVVVAAGNYGKSAKSTSPANIDGVIAVTALDRNGRKASFSSTVEDLRMGVAAPGVDIYSTLPGNTYGPLSGTSMATPYVSGLIGMMKSFRPQLTTGEVYKILKATGKPTPDGPLTGPLIQPLKAIEAVID